MPASPFRWTFFGCVWTLETFESYDDGGIDTIWTTMCISYDAVSNPQIIGNTVSGARLGRPFWSPAA